MAMLRSEIFIHSKNGVFRLVGLLKTFGVWEEYKKECVKYHKLASDKDGDVIRYLMIAARLIYYVLFTRYGDKERLANILVKKVNGDSDSYRSVIYDALSWVMVARFAMYTTSFDWMRTDCGSTEWSGLDKKMWRMIPEKVRQILFNGYKCLYVVTPDVVQAQEDLGLHTSYKLYDKPLA